MVLSIITFVAVTLSLIGLYYVVTGVFAEETSAVRRRMDSEFGRGAEGPDGTNLFKNLDLERTRALVDEGTGTAPPAAELLTLKGRLEQLLEQSALGVGLGQLLVITLAFGFSLGIAGVLFRGPLLGVLGALTGAALPLFYVNYRRTVRREKMLVQLPHAFDLMARVIRSGNSVPQALQAVADAMEAPLAGEFAQCQKQQHLGLRPEIAFQQLAERTGVLEMRIFVMAILIQRQSGGNLSDVLERLARLIRDRLRLRSQVRTLTAEGRLQGLTLMVLPVLLFAVMMVINRQYAEVLLEHKQLLLATGAAMTVGALWIRKIVNFEI